MPGDRDLRRGRRPRRPGPVHPDQRRLLQEIAHASAGRPLQQAR